MLDYVKKDGFFYRNAYPFSYKPAQVRLCSLPYRFVVFGLFRILLSFCLWILLGLIGGAVAWIIIVPFWILTGNKFVRNPKFQNLDPTPWLIGERFLVSLCLLSYKVVPIETLPTIAGKKILPWHVVASFFILMTMWYWVPTVGTAAVYIVQGILTVTTLVAGKFMEYSLWIPITIIAGFVVLSLVGYGVHEFRKSEMYALLFISFKGWMDKFCPILPVK